ncbi:hypothetical protein ABMA27_015541, partial [Loxostege sticticalis]
MEHNSETQGVMIINPMEDSLTSTHQPMQTREYRPADACTQVLLTFNNIETDISFAPIFENQSARIRSGDIAFYKPFGTNTDSMRLDTNEVPKTSVQMMTSFGPFLDPTKSSSTTSKPTPVTKASVNVSTSEHMIDDATKSDLSTETAPPCLMCTEAKIVSISSAQMLPAAVITSHTDLPPTGPPRNPVSTRSCQCNTTQSVTCRCNDPKVVSTALLQLCKSTAAQDTVTEDRSFGPSSNSQRFVQEKTTSTLNDKEIKQTRNLSTQALINQWCQSQMFVDTGTTPSAIEKKSTYVFTSVGQKSACAFTSVNRRPSSDSVKNSGFPVLQRASVSTNTSFSVERRSVGQSLPDVFSQKSQQKPTIDTWVQYSHILEQDGHHSIRSARIGHSKLMSSQPLNASSHATTHPSCYDYGTEPILPFPKSSMAVMTSGPFDEASDTTELKNDRQGLLCSCAQVGCNIETSTLSGLKLKQNRECSTQVFQSECSQNLDKCSSCGANDTKSINCSAYNR